MKKAVIYTSLTGGYDNLPQYEVLDDYFDYICFTNDYPEGSRVGQWEIRSIPVRLADNTRLSRYVKLMPHAVFPDYEYSVWLDANLAITDSSIYDILKSYISAGELWCAVKHPLRDCIYEEARACILIGKAAFNEIQPFTKFLKSKHFPRKFGLFENNFILRKHNDEIIKVIDDDWWSIYMAYSKRDQLSLCFLFWKHGFKPALLQPEGVSTRNISAIKYTSHESVSKSRKQKFLLYWSNRIRLLFSCSF